MFELLILKPISIIYSIILGCRHYLYDHKLMLKSTQFNHPIVVLGNLSLGGSGKTPHTIFIAQMLQNMIPTTILSRGYGRKSKTFGEVSTNSSYTDVGDEPLMMKKVMSNIPIFVCQNRRYAIELIKEKYKRSMILLDDAFQHRSLKTDMNILLTDYHCIYPNDHLIPFGSLRDLKNQSKRAQLIIITKCPELLSSQEKAKILQAIAPEENQRIFFSSLRYKTPLFYFDEKETTIPQKLILVTAIANSDLIVEYLTTKCIVDTHYKYIDHANFSLKEVKQWIAKAKISQIQCIATTHKDAIRLEPYQSIFEKNNISLIIFPIDIVMIREDTEELKTILNTYYHSFGLE